jgi:hypothetical protein
MRFLFTIGRLTLFDFKLFEIEDDQTEQPDVIVVHHHETEEEDDGPPGGIFGKGNG